jgi:hypothetical protein
MSRAKGGASVTRDLCSVKTTYLRTYLKLTLRAFPAEPESSIEHPGRMLSE